MAAAHEPDGVHVIIAHIFVCCARQAVPHNHWNGRQRGRPPALVPRRLSQPACVVLERVQKHAQ
jgi:hypothetical protein